MFSLTHLRYFSDAATLGSVGLAAKRNHVTPSAISQGIRSLEQYLDTSLVYHRRNSFALTPDGFRLLERGRALLLSAEGLRDELRQDTDTYTGTVTFATQQSIALHILPELTIALQKEHPGLNLDLRLGPTSDVKQWIETNDVEFALSVDNIDFPDVIATRIFAGHFVFVSGNRKRHRPGIDRFITPGATTREAKIFKREYTRVYGVKPNIVMEVKSWGVVKRYAELGLGTGIIPDYLLRQPSVSSLFTVNLGLASIPYEINVLCSQRRVRLSRNARMVTAFFQQRLGAVLE